LRIGERHGIEIKSAEERNELAVVGEQLLMVTWASGVMPSARMRDVAVRMRSPNPASPRLVSVLGDGGCVDGDINSFESGSGELFHLRDEQPAVGVSAGPMSRSTTIAIMSARRE